MKQVNNKPNNTEAKFTFDDVLLYFLLFVPMFVFGQSSSDATEISEKSLLWEVSGNGLEEPSYVFGTYHLLQDSYLEELPHVQQRYDNADGIVVETVIDTAAIMKMTMGMMLQGTSLEELIGKKDLKKLEKIWEDKTGTPLGMAKSFKPAVLSGQLMSFFDKGDLGAYMNGQGLPMDMYFALNARQQGRPVHSLESIDLQMNLLYGTPLEEQADILKLSIANIDEYLTMSRELVDLYIAQDLGGMAGLDDKYGDLATMGLDMADLLDKRNNSWMEQMPELLEKGNQFIAVGSLHLIGETGLINALRAEGYTVTPVYN